MCMTDYTTGGHVLNKTTNRNSCIQPCQFYTQPSLIPMSATHIKFCMHNCSKQEAGNDISMEHPPNVASIAGMGARDTTVRNYKHRPCTQSPAHHAGHTSWTPHHTARVASNTDCHRLHTLEGQAPWQVKLENIPTALSTRVATLLPPRWQGD